MKKRLSAVLGIKVATLFFLTLFLMSACAPTAVRPTKAKPKAKLALNNAFFSCSMTGSSKSCFAISPTPVKVKKKGMAILMAGSGFKPKQKLGIRLMMGGVLSDISFLVKPRPVANEFGAFASTWKLRREFKRKLLKPGTAYTVTLVDEDGNTLGTAPLVFEKAKKKAKKKK